MINRILMELYDDYEKGSVESIVEFTEKTFPQNGTDKLFIGCVGLLEEINIVQNILMNY